LSAFLLYYNPQEMSRVFSKILYILFF